MGTFNYGSSDYITLAFKEYWISDFDNDKDEIIDCMIDNGYGESSDDISDSEYEDYVYDLIADYEEDDYENIKYTLADYNFYYFHVVLESGYYHGSQIDIENNFSVAFDDCYEKREVQKEITEIKKFLHECADLGMRATWCGWCPKWFDRKETHKMIDEAIKEMREEVKNTPTWRQYENSCA